MNARRSRQSSEQFLRLEHLPHVEFAVWITAMENLFFMEAVLYSYLVGISLSAFHGVTSTNAFEPFG